MAFYEIQFDYEGNAPTASRTYNFCIHELGYDEDSVKQVGPITVNIDGSSKQNILDAINADLPLARGTTTYTEAL